jgi:hypothetical protein
VACAIFFVIIPLTAAAGEPNDYVFLPAVAYGEREIDFKLGTFKQSEEGRTSAASVRGNEWSLAWFNKFWRA